MVMGTTQGKYAALYLYLLNLKHAEWRASFDEIEKVLGFSLPASAKKYPAWWANEAGETYHVQALSWTRAGWRTSQVDRASESVVFVREED